MSEKKYYVVGATTPEAWEHVHTILTQDGTLDDNIPSRPVECTDLKDHSPTRAVYLLDDTEAEQLSQCSDIKFIQIDTSQYTELYPPIPEQLYNIDRYSVPIKNYRNLGVGLPSKPDQTDTNRTGYQILRGTEWANPWRGSPTTTIINSKVQNHTATGKDVDLIVSDDGCWFGHVEFANNVGGPDDYIGGNPLPGNGTCDLLDVVLDSPYYLDPDWFNASPTTRLMTRWDGTIVPVESVAKEWWANSSKRSPQFFSLGGVAISPDYTRANCNGSNTVRSLTGTHGTCCAGQAYGRTHGWAYNANKWFINSIGNYGVWPVDNSFDIIKIFHQAKPFNMVHGNKNPTITSNSWGFRENQGSTGWYYFRQGTLGFGKGIEYSTKPEFMAYLGISGDGGRFKNEMVDNNLTTAGDELIAAGVIFVVAAGNSNQKQVSSSHPDFNNYWSASMNTDLVNAKHTSLDGVSIVYNTINRRGFPQHIGKYKSGSDVIYPAINIGALDDQLHTDGKERKVNYSDMGNEIDVYTPGDNTLTSSWYDRGYARVDHLATGLNSYDSAFSGTSSACPTAAGMIATALEYNRLWNWQDIRAWLQSLDDQLDSDFYQGPEPNTPNAPQWSDLNSLMGSARKVLYNNITTSEDTGILRARTITPYKSFTISVENITPFTPVLPVGGTAPYTFSINPTLPGLLVFNTSTGEITGKATVALGASLITVTITDSSTPVVSSSSASFVLELFPEKDSPGKNIMKMMWDPFTGGDSWDNGAKHRVSSPLLGRGIPDVSAMAIGYNYYIDYYGETYYLEGVQGTSAVAPLLAGLIARLNSSKGTREGYVNPTWYAVARKNPNIFNDITVGNNRGPFGFGYHATEGWDACTGLGTPIGENLNGFPSLYLKNVGYPNMLEGTRPSTGLTYPRPTNRFNVA